MMSDFIPALLRKSVRAHVSDLFLTASQVPIMRIKGVLVAPDPPEILSVEDMEEFRKSALGSENEAEYQKTGTFDCSYSLPEGQRFRINFFTTIRGSAAAIRPLRFGSELKFKELNLPLELEGLCKASRGIILIAGSTGSGKSTTLSAMINHINQTQSKHILTIEDPIEFLHESKQSLISQREILAGGFADALHSALRENPDVIVIGEMRDTDTIQTALNAALTGHLVISTVHTSNTVQSVERIVNMFPESMRDQAAINLGTALLGVAAQRLIPMKDQDKMVPAIELLLGTPTVQKAVCERDYSLLEDSLLRGTESGMITFNRAIFRLFKDQVISLEDALKTVDNPDEFNLLVKGMERGVDAFRSHYGSGLDFAGKNMVDMRFLLKTAVTSGASDLHLTCDSAPVLRLHGALRAIPNLPKLASKDIEKLLYSLLSPKQRIELEEKRELDFAIAVTLDSANKQFTRFRVNAFYQRGSLGMVARVIQTAIPSAESLNLPPILSKLIEKEQGLFLVTGPTGSGKSTTLACLLSKINHTRNAKIITVEDPIEFVHENCCSIVEQRELHSDTLGFATALRSALRQDPDVIMVGEMRDIETISAAITAAETGHLVFATIHTNSAPQTIDRIIDSFPSHQQNQIRTQLAAVLLGVVSQQLLPKKDGKGRVAAFEIMVGTPPVRALIRDGKTFQLQTTMETSTKDGMITLDKYMEGLYAKGLITKETMHLFKADYKEVKEF